MPSKTVSQKQEELEPAFNYVIYTPELKSTGGSLQNEYESSGLWYITELPWATDYQYKISTPKWKTDDIKKFV